MLNISIYFVIFYCNCNQGGRPCVMIDFCEHISEAISTYEKNVTDKSTDRHVS